MRSIGDEVVGRYQDHTRNDCAWLYFDEGPKPSLLCRIFGHPGWDREPARPFTEDPWDHDATDWLLGGNYIDSDGTWWRRDRCTRCRARRKERVGR